MAVPTMGRWGTTTAQVVAYATGVDANPIRDGWQTNVTQASHADIQRVSNFMEDNGGGSLNCQAFRPGAFYPQTGIEFWCEIHTLGANGQDWELSTHVNDTYPLVGVYDLYQGVVTLSAGTDTWDIVRVLNGSGAVVGSSGAQNIAAGDYYDISIRPEGASSRVQTWYWNSAAAVGTWALMATFLDASPLPGGQFGAECTRSSNWSWGNIYGGIIPDTRPFVPLGRGASW